MTHLTSNNLVWLEMPEQVSMAIERGLVTFEDMEAAQNEYHAFIAELEKEWTPEKIKEWVLASYRAKCEWGLKRVKELELENRDARVKGMSYKERTEKYTKKIDAGRRVFEQWRQEGIHAKGVTFTVKDLVKPLDVPFIQARGMDRHLRMFFL